MKISKNIFICALLVLMLLVCVNAASAEETFNETLGADAVDAIAVDAAPVDELSANVEEIEGDAVSSADDGGEIVSASDADPELAAGSTIYVSTTGSDSNDGLSEANAVATINHAVDIADGKIVILAGEYTVTSLLNVTKDLEITGQGDVTIKSNSQYTIDVYDDYWEEWDTETHYTLINNTANLYLNNIKFTLVRATISDPLINNLGNLYVNTCEFNNIKISSGKGVIQNAKGAYLEVKDTTFKTASSTYGGINNNGELLVDGCKFLDNDRSSDSGVFSTAITSYNKATILNSEFENNKGTAGGAVYVMYSYTLKENPVMEIKNCTFTNNNAPGTSYTSGTGGAVKCSGKAVTLTIEDSTFTGNNAKNGGAVYAEGNVTIIRSTFHGNTASIGEDVYVASGSNTSVLGCTVDDSSYLWQADGGNLTIGEAPAELTNIVTQDNFYDFFDESGILLDTVPFDELIFQGEFSDLGAGYVIITKPIKITGDNAVLNNMGIVVSSGDVSINDLTLNADVALGDLVNVVESNVNLTNLNITYIVNDEAARAVSIIGAMDVIADNLKITYESHITDSSVDACAINIEESGNVAVTNSEINSSLPALLVNYDMSDSSLFMGLNQANPVRVVSSSNVNITKNKINSVTNDYSQMYATIQAMLILETSDCLVDSNNITLTDSFAQVDQDIYLYGISFAYDEGLVMSNNNFTVFTNGGKEAAGTAYAIQGIESDLAIVGNNITTFSNGPNLGIYVTSMAGEGSTMTIEKNFINVTGLAAAGNNWALVSGIEIQNGDAKVYNNTIYTYNVDEYDEDDYLSGISYIQYMYGGRTFDIQDNTVYTTGKYPIYLIDASNSIITGNTLYGHELTGDDAVYIQSGENNVVKDNLPAEELTNIVTNATFFKYFDEDGMLLDTVPFDELIFQGEFSDLVDIIIISDEITLTSDNAVLNNIALSIIGDDVKVTGFTFNADVDFTLNGGAVVYVSGMDVTLDNISVTYDAPSEAEAKAVFANGADGFNLINSQIIFAGVNPGSNHYRGLEVRNSDDAKIDNVTIIAFYPAVDVSWGGGSINDDLVLAVGIQGGNDVKFTNNSVNIEINGNYGSYPTADGVMIYSVNNILVKSNNITQIDTNGVISNYYYGLDIHNTTATVEDNNIFVNTISGRAYPVQLTGPFTITMSNNNLTVVTNGPADGIYASSWAGAAILTAENNIINVTGNATPTNYGRITGIEAEINLLKAYNNTIVVNNLADYDDANEAYGIDVVSQFIFIDISADIKDNNITVDGKYAVSYANAINTNVTGNTLYAHDLKGDDAANVGGSNNIVENNLPAKANITVEDAGAWIGTDATVTVNVPNATGTVTIEVNGKSYDVELVDGVATKTIAAEDLVAGENTVTATYKGTDFASNNATGVVNVIDGVVTQDNYMYYFNQDDSGKLFDYVPEGATLDFQGSIVNPDQSAKLFFVVSKPVNIVSTTEDGYVDLNTTAGSLSGENPGNRFTIDNGGSGTNVTGITFHNTQLWLTNTHNVILDNISAIVEDQRVGSGVGATSIRDNSTFVTVKNSYFYTRNNGGSSSLVLAWATNCTWDNNTIEVSGNVGNMLYLNTFNVDVPEGVVANQYNVIKNNIIINPGAASAISWGIVINGQNNLVENNTVYYKGVGIAAAYGGTATSNIYKGNKLYNGSSVGGMGTFAGCTFEDNYVSGAAAIGADCIFNNNTVDGKLTLRGANIVASENTINNDVTISAKNITFDGNNVTGTVTVSAAENRIVNNIIVSTGDYAVDLKTTKDNNVTGNLLIAKELDGDAAVKTREGNNLVENNRPVPAIITVAADNITVGQTAVINVTLEDGANGAVNLIVDGKSYTVDIVDGQGQVTIDGLAPSDYAAAAYFETSDIYFKSSENSTVFNVAKLETAIAIDVLNATLGEDATVLITIPNATGSVKIMVNGVEQDADLEDGQATYVIEDIAAGDYSVVVIYAGDKNNDAASNSTTFAVAKLTPEIVVDVPAVDYGSDAVITIEIANATGNVFVDVGANKYYAELENGVATITVPKVTENATVIVKYAGDDKYEAVNATAELIVNKLTTVLSGEDLNMAYKDGSAWTVTLTDAEGNAISGVAVKVGINVNGVDKVYSRVTDADGAASLPLNLNPGSYAITATFEGDDKYESAFTNATVTVGKAAPVLAGEDLTMTYKDGAWSVTLTGVDGAPISGVAIKIGINTGSADVVYSRSTDANGVASLPINLAPGSYAVNATFDGNFYYESAFVNATVTVEKAVATISGEDLTMNFKDGSKYNVTVVGADGAALAGVVVKFTIGNSNYNIKTDANGVASLPINLAIGEYTISAVVDDAKYSSDAISNAVSVENNLAISAADVNMTYKDGTAYEVQLVNGEGNPIALAGEIVKITVKGKTYDRKTDANGIASLPINLLAGEYVLTAEYNGVEITNNVTVNKA